MGVNSLFVFRFMLACFYGSGQLAFALAPAFAFILRLCSRRRLQLYVLRLRLFVRVCIRLCARVSACVSFAFALAFAPTFVLAFHLRFHPHLYLRLRLPWRLNFRSRLRPRSCSHLVRVSAHVCIWATFLFAVAVTFTLTWSVCTKH